MTSHICKNLWGQKNTFLPALLNSYSWTNNQVNIRQQGKMMKFNMYVHTGVP